jgi:hypothetical protein
MINWLGENGGELVETTKYLCVQKKKDLCVQIRFFCRLHRGCSARGSRMLPSGNPWALGPISAGYLAQAFCSQIYCLHPLNIQ